MAVLPWPPLHQGCLTRATVLSLLWCRPGALGALRESGCCSRAVGSGCWALAAARVPHHDRAPASFPRQLDGYLQPASAQALTVSHGLVPAGESGCRGVSPHALTFGYHPACSGQEAGAVEEGGMLWKAGERGEDRRSARYHIYSILSPQ